MLGLAGLWLTVAAVSGAALGAGPGAEHCDRLLSRGLKAELATYQPIVNKIIKMTVGGHLSGELWAELADFVDAFGNRIAGSETLDRAIDYVNARLHAYNLENVHTEPVQVPHWVRGEEQGMLVEPRVVKLPILGLGGSIGTPKTGITANVVAVQSFEELKSLGDDKVKGKIVVFCPEWVSYGETVKYRQYAAVEGAKMGAVATLVRSITPVSIATLHTGWQDYADNVTRIPTASITVEDAQMLLRMYRRSDNVKVWIKMEARTEADVTSFNSVAELVGYSKPHKTVLVSGHLDSWDVGTGAMDDGAGAFLSWYSLVVLQRLDLRPRRTIRAVLWTGEEEGLIGAFAYKKSHEAEEKDMVLLMESDEGTFTPQGLSFKGSDMASCIMNSIANMFGELNATYLERSNDVGSDIMVWADSGIPLAALKNANERYFWFHHSDGDRMTVEDSLTLDKCLAVWAATAYIVADIKQDLPR